jgi:hypothetical protein
VAATIHNPEKVKGRIIDGAGRRASQDDVTSISASREEGGRSNFRNPLSGSKMTDIPIIYSAPMVLALLREVAAPGTGKTMTRRNAWSQGYVRTGLPEDGPRNGKLIRCAESYPYAQARLLPTPWQRVKPGDRLWVRETWRVSRSHDATKPRDLVPRKMTTLYEAGGSMGGVTAFPRSGHRGPEDYIPDLDYPKGGIPNWVGKTRVAIHMPRWASRLTLVVTETKIERLQAITWDDAIAEGIENIMSGTWTAGEGFGRWSNPRFAFENLWKRLHGDGAWDANPEVVAPRFTVHARNIDAMEMAA